MIAGIAYCPWRRSSVSAASSVPISTTLSTSAPSSSFTSTMTDGRTKDSDNRDEGGRCGATANEADDGALLDDGGAESA